MAKRPLGGCWSGRVGDRLPRALANAAATLATTATMTSSATRTGRIRNAHDGATTTTIIIGGMFGDIGTTTTTNVMIAAGTTATDATATGERGATAMHIVSGSAPLDVRTGEAAPHTAARGTMRLWTASPHMAATGNLCQHRMWCFLSSCPG